MRPLQSRAVNVALILVGTVFTLLAIAGVIEALWTEGPAGLIQPNTIIMCGLFLGVGSWCVWGGWSNLRATRAVRESTRE